MRKTVVMLTLFVAVVSTMGADDSASVKSVSKTERFKQVCSSSPPNLVLSFNPPTTVVCVAPDGGPPVWTASLTTVLIGQEQTATPVIAPFNVPSQKVPGYQLIGGGQSGDTSGQIGIYCPPIEGAPSCLKIEYGSSLVDGENTWVQVTLTGLKGY